MITETHIDVAGRPAVVWQGGDGPPLLLIHGAWHGARAHWSRVWDRLGERYRVIAPEIPGIGDTTQPGLGRVSDHARWLSRVLDALGAPKATVVGNSFGAMLAWDFAGRVPERCTALFMVNGSPAPKLSPLVRALVSSFPLRFVLSEVFRKGAWTPAALDRAFASPANIPDDIKRTVAQAHPAQRETALRLIFRMEPPGPAPTCPKTIIWGEADRLPGCTKENVEKLQRLVDAPLRWIAGAGHLPQAEQPERFVEAIAGSR